MNKSAFLYFRRILRVAAKRKATEDISQRPSKVIKSVLYDIQEDHLQPKDLRSTSQAMYRERRIRHPSNPTSRNDVFEALRGPSVKSSKGENLLQVIDSDHGIVIFTTMTNLNFLCSDISDMFMDGTFKCCPKYFEQLYTLHGFKNGNYVPLIYCLLPGKSENVYQVMWSHIIDICSKSEKVISCKNFHVDFEFSVHKVTKEYFPDCVVKCCRFHIGQAWWRKIQSMGLRSEYCNAESDIGKLLQTASGYHS